ncbi:hypothetical protein NPIL_42701 [Nephila pilipes]|uniref:Uncharacterized protein n=1 Tax=Nephila pilipes TaxID=299642 RepID=A0A8X6N740_NEPPI|nr:hypothetical protein NPIL_42701 [Nephila pilipes]
MAESFEESIKVFGELVSRPYMFSKLKEFAEANPNCNNLPDMLGIYERRIKDLNEGRIQDELELEELRKKFAELCDKFVNFKEAVIKEEEEEYERVMKKRPEEKAYGKKRRQ